MYESRTGRRGARRDDPAVSWCGRLALTAATLVPHCQPWGAAL